MASAHHGGSDAARRAEYKHAWASDPGRKRRGKKRSAKKSSHRKGKRRGSSAYNRFVAHWMKKGYSMREVARVWRKAKKDSHAKRKSSHVKRGRKTTRRTGRKTARRTGRRKTTRHSKRRGSRRGKRRSPR